MKANKTITASTALAALAMVFLNHRSRVIRARRAEFENKCLREAIDTLEGEGGLVCS